MTFLKQKQTLWVLGVIFFIVDRLLKYFAVSNPDGNFLSFFPNFSLGFGLSGSGTLSTILLIFLVIIIIYFVISKKNFGWILILTGALSNLWDRLAFGYVVDYWEIAGAYINLADILILVGIAFLVCWPRFAQHSYN